MREIEVKTITPMEKVETVEAEFLYDKARNKYIFCFLIPFVIFCMFLIAGFATKFQIAVMVFMVLSGFATIIGLAVFFNLMSPYKELLRIARHNDLIRHDQKIRFREQKRLTEENKTTYTTKQIHETLEEYKKQDEKNNDTK